MGQSVSRADDTLAMRSPRHKIESRRVLLRQSWSFGQPASQPYMLLRNSKFVCTGGCDLNNNNNHSLLLVGKKSVLPGATTALIPPPSERTVVVPLSWCACIHTYIVWCASAASILVQHTTVVDCCGNPGTVFLQYGGRTCLSAVVLQIRTDHLLSVCVSVIHTQ